jgi:hypothetical protein
MALDQALLDLPIFFLNPGSTASRLFTLAIVLLTVL